MANEFLYLGGLFGHYKLIMTLHGFDGKIQSRSVLNQDIITAYGQLRAETPLSVFWSLMLYHVRFITRESQLLLCLLHGLGNIFLRGVVDHDDWATFDLRCLGFRGFGPFHVRFLVDFRVFLNSRVEMFLQRLHEI